MWLLRPSTSCTHVPLTFHPSLVPPLSGPTPFWSHPFLVPPLSGSTPFWSHPFLVPPLSGPTPFWSHPSLVPPLTPSLPPHLLFPAQTEVAHMLIECCSQERSYQKFYGLLAQVCGVVWCVWWCGVGVTVSPSSPFPQRFCLLNQMWVECFDKAFQEQVRVIYDVAMGVL